VPSFSEEEIREFVRRKSQELGEVLLGDPVVARRELQRRISKLVLTPRRLVGRRTLEVTGDVSLFSRPDVMLTNSSGGIGEHYTPSSPTDPIDRLGDLLPAIRLSGIELQPQPLLVHFSAKAIRALRTLVLPISSDCLQLIPERL
jgi:hypothetical protein